MDLWCVCCLLMGFWWILFLRLSARWRWKRWTFCLRWNSRKDFWSVLWVMKNNFLCLWILLMICDWVLLMCSLWWLLMVCIWSFTFGTITSTVIVVVWSIAWKWLSRCCKKVLFVGLDVVNFWRILIWILFIIWMSVFNMCNWWIVCILVRRAV